jgi:hypothetical protein
MEGARRADLRTTLSSRVQLPPATSRPKLQPTRRVTDRSAHIFYQCSGSKAGFGSVGFGSFWASRNRIPILILILIPIPIPILIPILILILILPSTSKKIWKCLIFNFFVTFVTYK